MNTPAREGLPEMPEAVAWSSGLDWHPNPRHESEMVVKLTRKEQTEHSFTLGLYTADQMRAMYLAGIAAARECVPEPPEQVADSDRDWCVGYHCCHHETLTNLTALEQEAKK